MAGPVEGHAVWEKPVPPGGAHSFERRHGGRLCTRHWTDRGKMVIPLQESVFRVSEGQKSAGKEGRGGAGFPKWEPSLGRAGIFPGNRMLKLGLEGWTRASRKENSAESRSGKSMNEQTVRIRGVCMFLTLMAQWTEYTKSI